MMKRAILVLFFVPGVLLASNYCDYFYKGKNGDIFVRASHHSTIMNICGQEGSYKSNFMRTAFNDFCDSIYINDDSMTVNGDYHGAIDNTCFIAKVSSDESTDGFWHWLSSTVSMMGRIYTDVPYYWRR